MQCVILGMQFIVLHVRPYRSEAGDNAEMLDNAVFTLILP